MVSEGKGMELTFNSGCGGERGETELGRAFEILKKRGYKGKSQKLKGKKKVCK